MDFARPAKDTELANVTLSGDEAIEGSGAPDSEESGSRRRVSFLNSYYETSTMELCMLPRKVLQFSNFVFRDVK